MREVETTNLVMLVEEPTFNHQTNEDVAIPEHEQSDGKEYMGRQTQEALLDRGCSESLVSVTALVTSHLELSQIKPKLENLDLSLKSRHLIKDIVNHDGDELPMGETWSNLMENVQASDKEILQALQDLEAVRIDGGWMGVSQETYSSFVKLVLLTAAEQGWSLEKIPCVQMALELEKHGVNGQLTLQLLHKISNADQNYYSFEDLDRKDWREMPNPPPPCSLNTDSVCRHLGIGLLLGKKQWEDKDEFMDAWKKLLPEHIHPNMDMLKGECLEIDSTLLGEHGKKTTKVSVRKLSVNELPRDPSQRFKQLFSVQREWKYAKVQPYICKLTGPGQTVEELLLKYARPCQTHPEDDVTYTAR